MKLLHLITTGRKTGKQHERELYYFDHDDKLVITASAGGRPNSPDWYWNLRADPHVRVRLGKKEYAATAEEADPALRKDLWAELVSQSPMYADYQKNTTRIIPMVLLTLQS
jgi:deazaflavin-dependent oxidoreductase (nitroreductase family)